MSFDAYMSPVSKMFDSISQVDGNEADPIAICGFSAKFPQEATSSESFWKILLEKRCVSTDFPPDRLSLQGFHHETNHPNTIPLRGGHFIEEDLSLFDANFFSISPAEAAAMDPMQRWLLEVTYQALENAGISMEEASGSRTAVYTGSFGYDYMIQLYRDPEAPPKYAAVGVGLSMLANRVSWFFNLQGPSVGLDTACSSAATAVDIACQTLRSGSCDMCLVSGCSLTFSPESYVSLTNLDFLSPDSRCFSFDQRANGYSRGEGISVVVLKRLSSAIRDGNMIRAVIRSTASNEDGKTPGITQPSREAQERLIRETYRRAGLSMSYTRFFEAHGTGTAIGDPREAQAIGSVFRDYRTNSDPLYIGAVKSNIGHLEGASGLAGIIKAVLVLEKGVIPANANFETTNQKIDEEYLRIKFPKDTVQWPSRGLRRASVNSFGYGGANSHIVLDDAYHYLLLRSLSGNHRTQYLPEIPARALRHTSATGIQQEAFSKEIRVPKLIVWSAVDKEGTARVAQGYENYGRKASGRFGEVPTFLADLAYTLDTRRTNHPWRSFALLRAPDDISNLKALMSNPVQASPQAPQVAFVFTGQGAQWHAMGRELMHYSSFMANLRHAEEYLQSIGCSWQAIEELKKPAELSNVDMPELSQTLCTVLQIAIVDILGEFGVRPSAVMGHSSGEIAAAYAGGHITAESAWKLAYFRGLCSEEISTASKQSNRGAMLSVGLSEGEAQALLHTMDCPGSVYGLAVACINSPTNVTVSGDEVLINQLQERLTSQGVFTRKLRVTVAYHSRQMESMAAKYIKMIGHMPIPQGPVVPMTSTVTGQPITTDILNTASYWARNMVSPVRFSEAITVACAQSPTKLRKKIDGSHRRIPKVDVLIEIGPHGALRGPIRDTLFTCPRGKAIVYLPILQRDKSAQQTTLDAMGQLHCMGVKVNIRAINEPAGDVSRIMLVDLPAYPFDHSRGYWHESRLSRNYRLRMHGPSELLGVRANDWNPSNARWRLFINTTEMPWAEKHVINGLVLYPATGMLVMAIEAAKQLSGDSTSITGFLLQDVHFVAAMDLSKNRKGIEAETTLQKQKSESSQILTYDFSIHTYTGSDCTLNCRGLISVEKAEASDKWLQDRTSQERISIVKSHLKRVSRCDELVHSEKMYNYLQSAGLDYGSDFRALRNQAIGLQGQATAEVLTYNRSKNEVAEAPGDTHVVHPTTLDAIFHLTFTALTRGGTRPMATSVPNHLASLWLSSSGLSGPKTERLNTSVVISKVTKSGLSCTGIATDTLDAYNARVWYDGLELTNLTDTPASQPRLPNPRQSYLGVDLKPALDMLSSKETCTLVKTLHPLERQIPSFSCELNRAVEISLCHLFRSLGSAIPGDQKRWKKHYFDWVQHHHTRIYENGDCVCHCPDLYLRLQEALVKLSSEGAIGQVYQLVSNHLVAIFRDELDPLELLLQDNALNQMYDDMLLTRCASQIATYMSFLAHQRPGMKLLEIGAGTGAGTRLLLNALRNQPGESSAPLRCSRYDFTDISSEMVEKAASEFEEHRAQMKFGTLDMEHDLSQQGYTHGEYDAIIGASVLHITSTVESTLRNLRKGLKTGGKLILQEIFDPSGWTLGFIFGLLPSWWFGVDDSRVLSASLSVEAWGAMLKRTGFSGIDIELNDLENLATRDFGWIVSTAVEAPLTITTQPRLLPHITLIVSEHPEQGKLARNLESSFRSISDLEPSVLNIDSITDQFTQADHGLTICLLDYGTPFFRSLNQKLWNQLKTLVLTSHRLLWISGGGGSIIDPNFGIADGLSRTLRSEHYDLHLVTLGLDMNHNMSVKPSLVMKVVQAMMATTPHQNYEEEYIEVDGILHTRRLVETNSLKSRINATLSSHQTHTALLKDLDPFHFSASIAGDDNSPCFLQSANNGREAPSSDEIDIMIRAVSLQGRDRALVLKDEKTPTEYGSACAGFVQRSSPTSPFRPGDRVFAIGTGLFRSHIRLRSCEVVRIPAHMSYSDACWAIPPMIAAHEAFSRISHAKPSDRIMVLNGSSLLGQAVIHYLRCQNLTEIWTTAADEDDHNWIKSNMDISSDQILLQSWFQGHTMLTSQWKRYFDIVMGMDKDLGESLMLSYVKHGGHYITFRTSRSMDNHTNVVRCAPPTVCLSIIQVGGTYNETRSVAGTQAMLQQISDLAASWVLREVRRDIAIFPASEYAVAFDVIKKATGPEVVVVEFENMDRIDVQITTQPDLKLKSHATYLIAGGLGGLGRSMARWLMKRGAQNIILLSRSGPQTQEAFDLLEELRKTQIRVETPRCDITNARALKEVIACCAKTMPPIKGCIQATMIMKEAIFQKLSFSDWQDALGSKVIGSWNLHQELPKGLDFFFMISSMAGIIGRTSLSAYNAGNTYQDALAHYRAALGEHATSIDVGAVADGGYLFERTNRLSDFQRRIQVEMVYTREIYAMLDVHCESRVSSPKGSVINQHIIGIKPPSYWKHLDDVSFTISQPLWGHLHHVPVPSEFDSKEMRTAQKNYVSVTERMAAMQSVSEMAHIAGEELAERVCSLLGTTRDLLDPEKSLHTFGIDSLNAVELRNWIAKTFNTNIPLFDLLGGATLASTSVSIAQKVKFGK
ncbi:putative polyketide synthase [Xylaria intraflava]|nr:putative polyketide synthase [Xylaria intraflava]